MQNDIAVRSDLNRFADDGCPHISGETETFDLMAALWDSPDDGTGDASFALSFDPGGEG